MVVIIPVDENDASSDHNKSRNSEKDSEKESSGELTYLSISYRDFFHESGGYKITKLAVQIKE